MTNVYQIPEFNRSNVEKAVSRYQKKAAKYEVPFTVTYGAPYAQDVIVKELDYVTQTWVDTGIRRTVECFDLTIESEIIRKDGYTVLAKIEHLEGGNVVSVLNGEMKPEWAHLKPHCDHCNGNHGQKVTFIVSNGDDKQIGRTCLKEYCGIDPQAIGWSNDLVNFLYEHDVDHSDMRTAPRAYPIDKALAYACMIYRKFGYVKSSDSNSNKGRMFEAVAEKHEVSEADISMAKRIIEAVKAMDVNEAVRECLSDVQTFANCGYCKESHFGFIAYAPLAYTRYMERMAKKAEQEAAKAAECGSEFVGEVGKRMIFNIKSFGLVTSWENQYGWTYLYKFTDTNGNVLVWFASQVFGHWTADGRHYEEYTNVNQIKATVKDHNERDGVKQTIITRCAIA